MDKKTESLESIRPSMQQSRGGDQNLEDVKQTAVCSIDSCFSKHNVECKVMLNIEALFPESMDTTHDV